MFPFLNLAKFEAKRTGRIDFNHGVEPLLENKSGDREGVSSEPISCMPFTFSPVRYLERITVSLRGIKVNQDHDKTTTCGLYMISSQ